MRKHLTALLFLMIAPACVSPGNAGGVADDPRVGDLGRIRFAGGGGCNSSTTVALGSTARLTMEPAVEGEALPAGLEAVSANPSVLEVRPGSASNEILLTGVGSGESMIEIQHAGELYDALLFDTDVATSAQWDAPEAVLAGTTAVVTVSEIFGPCGEECPLIGADFMRWEAAGDVGLTLISDIDRVATFEVGDGAGRSVLRGYEPETGALLVSQELTVVEPSEVSDPSAEVVVMLPDETVLDPTGFPAEVPVGSLLQVRVSVSAGEVVEIPLTTREATWTLVEGEDLLQPLDGDSPSLEGPIYRTGALGEATFRLEIELLHHSSEHHLTIVE